MAIVMMLVCQSTEHDTPYAELKAGILNPSAFEQNTAGKTYRMTLEQVD